jgi:amino acid adenylation domain-containing protein
MNHYGPTEVTIGCIAQFIDMHDLYTYKTRPTIGKPIFNTQVYILDRYLNVVPIGIQGELCLSGAGTARGYYKREALTAKKFIMFQPDPDVTPVRIYRSGDLARWLPGGIIEFLGRIDQQVKIRGYRIEPSEIENQLLELEEIEEAVVLAYTNQAGIKYLCAYIVPRDEGTFDKKIPGLKDYLSHSLPDYMIPTYIMKIEKIPLTPNGKVQRNALPEPGIQPGSEYAAPRDKIEEKLVDIWSGILGTGAANQAIGINDNFFQLGGQSLNAIIMLSKIHKELDVKVPLAEIFRTHTIKGLSCYIKGAAENRYASIEPVEKKEYYPLSSAQKRLYILRQMDPQSTAYNMPELIPLEEGVRVERLEHTFKELINRHQSPRTSFHMVDNQPVQAIHDTVDFRVEYYDSAGGADAVRRSFVRPFDLTRAPLLRVGLIEARGANYFLAVDMHHIISDGVTHNVLTGDFMALYTGEELPPLRLQYKDFSQWQNSDKEQENLKQQEAYWQETFAGEIPVLNLPADYPRPVIRSFEGRTERFEISREETVLVKQYAREEGVTTYMLMLSILNVLLSKLSRQESIVVGIPVAGRRHADLEKIIGMFVNTLPLLNYPQGEKTAKEFLGDVKERTLAAFENQDYPFEDLVEKVAVKRDTGRNPLFDVLFVMQVASVDIESDEMRRQRDAGAGSEIRTLEGRNSAKFDLTLRALGDGENLGFSITYCTKLFKPGTIRRFIAYFKKITAGILKNIEIPLSQIEIISEEEKQQLLNVFNKPEVEYPGDKTIHQWFEEQVAAVPHRIALRAQSAGHRAQGNNEEPHALTYKRLNEISNQLADLLMEKGVKPGDIVALAVKRSLEMIAGIMGILKAGGAYLPIEPGYPRERINYILKDSGTKILLSAGHHPSFPASQLLSFPSSLFFPSSHLPSSHLPLSPAPVTSLAYIIYTSGTTGNPKGVMVGHRNVAYLVNGLHREIYRYFDGYVNICMVSPYVFDASVKQVFGALLLGHSLHVVPGDIQLDGELLLHYYNRHEVDVSDGTPTHLRLLVESMNDTTPPVAVKRFIIGGEALFPGTAEAFLNRVDPEVTRIINIYGPTECTVDATLYGVKPDDSQWFGSIPIGRPMPNCRVHIVSRGDRLQPVGVPGELCISGAGVGLGYLNRPELTAEKFVHDLWDYQDKNKGTVKKNYYNYRSYKTYISYRTGDLARWLPNGNIAFLGRIDHQVKIRGYRIELGEIENRLLKHDQVKEALVTASMEETADKYICAYIVPRSASAFDHNTSMAGELRTYLSETLPGYMIPAYFMKIENIPLTPNGKVDRKALPAPETVPGPGYVAPRNAVEETLVQIWSEVLSIENTSIGIDDNFFELGGHSLKATTVTAKIRSAFNIDMPLVELFKIPTIKLLAGYTRTAELKIFTGKDNNLVLLKVGIPDARHLFLVHDGTGEVEGYIEFCNHLSGNFNYWGIRADRVETLAPQNRSIEEVAQRYIEKIKRLQPHGPYHITGWSLGGTIAFEMVKQLEQMKEEIVFLALIDSPSPQQCSIKNIPMFTLESEKNFIKKYLPDREFENELEHAADMENTWSFIIDYLESNNFDVEIIKKVIVEYEAHVVPGYHQLNIGELIQYLNIGRTFHNARASYIPPGKIHTPVHYYAASQSKEILKESWNAYCDMPIKFYEIPGDHYSIFKMPQVLEFAKIFCQAIGNL